MMVRALKAAGQTFNPRESEELLRPSLPRSSAVASNRGRRSQVAGPRRATAAAVQTLLHTSTFNLGGWQSLNWPSIQARVPATIAVASIDSSQLLCHGS